MNATMAYCCRVSPALRWRRTLAWASSRCMRRLRKAPKTIPGIPCREFRLPHPTSVSAACNDVIRCLFMLKCPKTARSASNEGQNGTIFETLHPSGKQIASEHPSFAAIRSVLGLDTSLSVPWRDEMGRYKLCAMPLRDDMAANGLFRDIELAYQGRGAFLAG